MIAIIISGFRVQMNHGPALRTQEGPLLWKYTAIELYDFYWLNYYCLNYIDNDMGMDYFNVADELFAAVKSILQIRFCYRPNAAIYKYNLQ